MSNFFCEKCGASIVEDENGNYVTKCEHYPLTNKRKENSMQFTIAGVKFHEYKQCLNDITEGDTLKLVPEPANKFDPNAVAIYFDNGAKQSMLGYVPKRFSSEVSAMIEVGQNLECILTKFNRTATPWDMFSVTIKEIEE